MQSRRMWIDDDDESSLIPYINKQTKALYKKKKNICIYLYNETVKNTAIMASKSLYKGTRMKPGKCNVDNNKKEIIV